MNMLEQFEYSAYTNMLIIDRIFVKIYNDMPDWKMPNPP